MADLTIVKSEPLPALSVTKSEPLPDSSPSPLAKLGSAFWEGIGGKAAMDIIGGASRDPERAKKALETVKGLVHGIANEPSRFQHEGAEFYNSLIHGDKPGDAAYHLAGAVPVVGAGAQQVAHDFENKDYATGFGHALALLLPFAAKGSGAAAKLGDAAESTVASVKRGAAIVSDPEVWRAGVKVLPKGPAMVKLVDEVQRVRGASQSPEPVPVTETPGQILAKQSGADWAKLSPDDRMMLEQAAKARQNVAAQPQPVTPAAAPPPQPVQPQAPPPQVQPVPEPQPMIGAHPTEPVLPRGNAPVRPPLRSPQAPPEPTSATPQGPAAPAPPAERSTFTAAGEPKSPQLRVAEKIQSARTAKVEPIAQSLFEKGITSAQARQIPDSYMSQKQMESGAMPGWRNVAEQFGVKQLSEASIEQAIARLQELERAAKPGPVPVKPNAGKLARQLADEMRRSGTLQ